jgi:hypothetical protein
MDCNRIEDKTMKSWDWASDPPEHETDENGNEVLIPWETVRDRYREHVNTAVEYGKIPNPKMVIGIRNYADYGIMPGHFLTALITNDLRGTFNRADETNRELIPEWLTWTWNYAPGIFAVNSVDEMVEHCRKMT